MLPHHLIAPPLLAHSHLPPTGVRQSATGFEFLTLISAKLTLNTEGVPQCSIWFHSVVHLLKLMTLTLTIKNRAGPVMLSLKFQVKIQTLLKTMPCHTILSANQPEKLFSWLSIKLQGLQYSTYEKNNDKAWYIWVWPWEFAVTAAGGALH